MRIIHADAAAYARDTYRDLIRAVRTDTMGNVVGTIDGGDTDVVVAAHMDEIGFMIRHVTEEGFVQVDALGGWDPRGDLVTLEQTTERVGDHVTVANDVPGFEPGNQRASATPVGAISVPTRYLHTVTESAHVDDIGATIDLLAAFLETETGDHDYRL